MIMSFSIRRASVNDRPRLLEISSQIWEGDDYIPNVIDTWITDPNAELAVAVEKGTADGKDLVIAFARCSRLASGYAWLEGARTDPGYRNRGASKALLRYFLAQLQAEDAKTVALSTYVENKASIHIIEREGFRRREEYVYAERTSLQRGALQTTVSEQPAHERDQRGIHTVDARAGLRFWKSLREPVRFVPDGWKFIPAELGHRPVEARLELLATDHQKPSTAVAVISKRGVATGILSIGLYATDPGDAGRLLDEANRRYPVERSELMIWPSSVSSEIVATARDRGYSVWNDGNPDVFIYELTLAMKPQSTTSSKEG